jgi:hypothetical protein
VRKFKWMAGLCVALSLFAATPVGASSNDTVKLATQYACMPSLRFKPTQITLACADDNAYLGSIHWSTWTSTQARGVGTYMLNSCNPNCASSRITPRFAVDLTASRPRVVRGIHYFSLLRAAQSNGHKVLVLHWIGSPTSRYSSWESPSGRTLF